MATASAATPTRNLAVQGKEEMAGKEARDRQGGQMGRQTDIPTHSVDRKSVV